MQKKLEKMMIIIRKFAKKHLWIFTFVSFVVGVGLGTGSIWSYLEYGISMQTAWVEKVELENNLMNNLLSLQSEILEGTRDYIDARTAWGNLKGKSNNDVVQRYTLLKVRMIKLISDYNATEVKLAISEGRQAIWFDFNRLLPPRRVQDVNIEVKDDGVPYAISFRPGEKDEVVKEVNLRIKNLFQQYGVPYPN